LRGDERLVLQNLQTREPIPHQRYVAHLVDGKTIAGVSDEHGRTALIQDASLGPVRFELLP
jgi:type VI secretion system secreted protein VgrG